MILNTLQLCNKTKRSTKNQTFFIEQSKVEQFTVRFF